MAQARKSRPKSKPESKPGRGADTAPSRSGASPTAIPARELRNFGGRILRQVQAGHRFVITVSGHEVAELAPVTSSRSWFVPRSTIVEIIRNAPLDRGFIRDIDSVLAERVDEL